MEGTKIYKGISFDDIVTDEHGEWSQVCKQHMKPLKFETHFKGCPAEETICGVEGCEKEAHFYIDFK